MKTGIVGFFDILGYQNFINNNEIEKTIEIISDVIMKLPEKVQKIQANVFNKWKDKNGNEQFIDFIQAKNKHIKPVIISDSILITLPVDEYKYKKLGGYYWFVFLTYSCMLLNEFFNNGLPLRGAIDFGKYYSKEGCVAGKTIINGYRFSNKFEFSGCALCDNASLEIKKLKGYEADVVEFFLFEYLMPLKNNVEEKRLLLNWIVERSQKGIEDVKQYVFEAFHAHNKDVSSNVLQKLNNTENFLRYCYIINNEREALKLME